MHKQYYIEAEKSRKAESAEEIKKQISNNGIYDRYEYPVLTREFARYTGDMI